MALCRDPELMPEPEEIAKALREPLLKVFPPALLGRLLVDPVLSAERRDDGRHHPAATRTASPRASAPSTSVPFTYDDEVVSLIASRCNEPESGGRMIDAILTNTMLPAISGAFLRRLLEGGRIARVRVGVADGDLVYNFD